LPQHKTANAGRSARRRPQRHTAVSLVAPGDDRRLERHLGNAVRALRQQQRLRIQDVAEQAGISPGMLSKIETGQAATSLDTLARLSQALGASLSQLFRDFDAPSGGAQLVKHGAGMEVVRRGTKRGHTYHLLAYDKGPRKSFEPFFITMDDASETFPSFQHPGTEFIYMLKGRIEYRHGRQTYVLEPGDSLTFRGEVPHGPERLIQLPIHFLSIIIYGAPEESA
jgi:transcriptional regulator with XRE-family HTH domain